MGKRHLKRIAAPKTWPIKGKEGGKFVIKPAPGGQSLMFTLPLGLILRDLLKKATTRKEVKKILFNKLVEVDCKPRRKIDFPVGLFDTIRIPTLDEAFRLVLNEQGKLTLIQIPYEESNKKIVKINVKKHVKGGDIQLGFSDGRTMIIPKTEKDNYKVGESVLMELPTQKIVEKYKLEKDCLVYVIRGKHAGKIGRLKEINEKIVTIVSNDSELKTRYNYTLAISSPSEDAKIKLA